MKGILTIGLVVALGSILIIGGCAAVVGIAMSSDSGPDPETAPKAESDDQATGGGQNQASDGVGQGSGQDKDDQSKPEGVLVLRVSSTGSTSANSITFIQPDSNSFEMSQNNGVSLPWQKKWTGVDSLPLGWNMNAQQSGGGKITCTVTLDGKVVAQNSSSGQYALVTCAK